MKTRLVQIGNSRGVRLPAGVIKACGFDHELEMRIEDGTVVLEPMRKVREGWDQAFEAMAESGDDKAVMDDGLANEFDREDWTW